MRKGFAVVSVVTMFTVLAVAIGRPAVQAQAPAPTAPTAARPAGIDSATAKKMVEAAEAAAGAMMAKVGIAVVDVNGDLVAFVRMDGAPARAVVSSQGKARAALLFGMSTKQVQDLVAAGQPVPAKVTMPIAGAFELTPTQGGLPLVKDGKIIAAIGVGGAAPANDEKFAQAGLDALR